MGGQGWQSAEGPTSKASLFIHAAPSLCPFVPSCVFVSLAVGSRWQKSFLGLDRRLLATDCTSVQWLLKGPRWVSPLTVGLCALFAHLSPEEWPSLVPWVTMGGPTQKCPSGQLIENTFPPLKHIIYIFFELFRINSNANYTRLTLQNVCPNSLECCNRLSSIFLEFTRLADTLHILLS